MVKKKCCDSLFPLISSWPASASVLTQLPLRVPPAPAPPPPTPGLEGAWPHPYRDWHHHAHILKPHLCIRTRRAKPSSMVFCLLY